MNASAFATDYITTEELPAQVTSSAIMDAPANLNADVDALEHSLALSLSVPATSKGYEPDLFVRAIHAIHTRLEGVRDALLKQQAELVQREMALQAREKAVERREAKVAALVALAPLMPATGQRRRFWGLFKGA